MLQQLIVVLNIIYLPRYTRSVKLHGNGH